MLPFRVAGGDGGEGFVDRVEGGPLPVLRVFGWYSSLDLPAITVVLRSGREIAPLSSARVKREDVRQQTGHDLFSGFRADFLIEVHDQPDRLVFDGLDRFHFPSDLQNFGAVDPHYAALFTTESVLGRESIYGSGPPVDVSGEFKEFAELARGRVLDFGCGNGDLVEHLVRKGSDARGLELDEDRIRNSLKESVRERITLYDGGMPLPYADGEFDAIVTTEVIEHVPQIADYVPELARVLKMDGRLLITTPDITSIPSSFPANCVPWHLLEATHINFFTPRSVNALFSPFFSLERFYCLGSGRVNDFFVPGSIGAVFRRRSEQLSA